MNYPVENMTWLATFLWSHFAIWSGAPSVWPVSDTWRVMCGDLDAIYWPGGNWKMHAALRRSGSTVQLIGGRVTTDLMIADRRDLDSAIGCCFSTTIFINAVRYHETQLAISHERGHALDAIFGFTDDPEVVAFFKKKKPVEEWAQAFARFINNASWSKEENAFVARQLQKRGLV